jgi:hypothetical protein
MWLAIVIGLLLVCLLRGTILGNLLGLVSLALVIDVLLHSH